MADRKTFSRYNMRCGLVLKAKEAGVKLLGFDIPQLDQRFTVITAKDLENSNQISFFGGSMPLLAKDKIEYVGQPLLALFGPDSESVELVMEKITVKTEALEKDGEKRNLDIPTLSFSWGQEEVPKEENLREMKKVDSIFKINHTTFISTLRYTVSAWLENNVLHIQTPTQWPDLVRSTVASAAGMDKKSVIIHTLPYYPRHDEYLIYPAVYASLAAIVALSSKLPVEIRSVGEAAKAGVVVKRTTYLNEENRPINESVVMSVDQGAYAFASSEYQRQAMAGLIPLYNVKSFKAEIIIMKSQNPPASFSGSLGYAEALAASEHHTSRISEKIGYTPAQIRDIMERGKTRFTDYAPPYSLEGKKRVDSIVKKSFFNRKWASNSFHRGDFGLLGCIKGVGIATGVGISGFSTSMIQSEEFFASISYTAKRHIVIASTAPTTSYKEKTWKNTIASKLSDKIEVDNITFTDQGTEGLDGGPDVLSRYSTLYTNQIATAAKSLSTILEKGNKNPVQLRFKTEVGSTPCEFEYSGFGAMIIEIEISKVDYLPMVKEAWGSFSISDLQQENENRHIARRMILNTIKECGGTLSESFKLNLEFTLSADPADQNAPIGSIVRGLTLSAFSNAICQAAGEEASYLPVSAKKLEKILNGGKI